MLADPARLGSGRADGAADPAASLGGLFGYELLRLPVAEVQIGAWHLASKQPEHVVLSVSGSDRTVRLEVMQLGVIRRIELPFDDIGTVVAGAENGYDGEEGTRLVVRCVAPPRFEKEAPAGVAGAGGGKRGGSSAQPDYVETADFTSGNALTFDTHIYRFAPGVLEKSLERLRALGLPFDGADSAGLAQVPLSAMAAEAAAAAQARRPKPYVPRALNTGAVTASPRLQAVALMEQLEREMSDRQARYAGICPVRAGVYEAVFTELAAIVRSDELKRGALLERVRAEAVMSISVYSTVFEHSTDFGSRKLARAIELKADLEPRVAELKGEIGALKKEVAALSSLVETQEARAAEEAKRSEVKAKDVLELERSNAMLQLLLEVLKPSAPHKETKPEQK
mmetsp:Transcript_29515/g.67670  ORF Transcript_29515/g.67670 Transcript_29515/m.67670 type:complete len:397 (-) Transcript_29515:289-1479(-)